MADEPENPLFARALANRIRDPLVGRGIVDPVDDLARPTRHPTPSCWTPLAWASHRFSLRHLVRTILRQPHVPAFLRAQRHQHRGRAVLLASGFPATSGGGAPGRDQPGHRARPRSSRGCRKGLGRSSGCPAHPARFLKTFGQPARELACECERTNDTTLAQSFALISGRGVDAKLKRTDNRIGHLQTAGRSNADIVTELYLATVSREPSSAEIEQAVRYAAEKPDRRAALEDVLWALLNSRKFLLRR